MAAAASNSSGQLTNSPLVNTKTTSQAAATGQLLNGSTWSTASSVLLDEISQTKIIASLVLFVVTLLCGYLPVRMILNHNYVEHAMFFGGGVLMATAFCHLIPEAHDAYKHLYLVSSSPMNNKNYDPATGFVNHQPDSQQSNGSIGMLPGAETATVDAKHGSDVRYVEIAICFGFFFMYLAELLMAKFVSSHTHEQPCNLNTVQQQDYSLSCLEGARTGSSAINLSPSGGSSKSELYKFMRGLLTVSAFLLHSIFDGVAIGSQNSVAEVWTVFAAISCHKLVIAAVIGFELFAATLESHLWTLVHLTIFSVMSPLGILLVVLAQDSFSINSNSPSLILLQSFATGTLLYVIFVEILRPKEDASPLKSKIFKMISLIAGFALMVTTLTLFENDDNDA